jgi:hypothetical protein
MMKRGFLLMLLLGLFFSSFSYSVYIQLSDQGTSAKESGALIDGDLTVMIYTQPSGGSAVWQETFTNAVKNGSWNIMLGQNPANRLELEFGRLYYKDYEIDGTPLSFEDNSGGLLNRLAFYSPLGYFTNASLFNFSMIDACASGYVIRQVNEDGSVVCEQLSSGGAASGWNDTGSVVELIYSSRNVDANTLFVHNTDKRVGIGTSSPSRQLSLTDVGLGFERITTNVLGFYTNNIERMRLDASGNLGIGTTSLSDRLDVNGTAIIRGILSMNSNRITNLAEPSASSDAATRHYVDTKISSEGGVTSGWNDTGSVVELIHSTRDVDANTLYVDNTLGRINITGDVDMGGYDLYNIDELYNVDLLHAERAVISNTKDDESSIPDGNSIYVKDDIRVGGNIQGSGADIAENVFVSGNLESGDVVVISGDLLVKKSNIPYDTRVAGIISTKPAYLLAIDRKGLPLALSGTVPTKVVNETGFIKPGDLLTTSSTPGHAMRCESAYACMGSLVGKAMGSLSQEKGIIEVLVMLG